MNQLQRIGAGMMLAALCVTSARAESGTFGIEAGVSASSLSPETGGETIGTGAGAVAGFYAVIPILKSVSVVTELLYVQRYSTRTVGSSRTDIQLEYVELPLLAKMPFLRGTYFTEGITLGFPVNMHGLAPNLVQITSPDVAVVIGGGYDVAKKLALEFRYDSSLRRVSTVATAPVQRGHVCMILAKLHF